ncbi:hypothetical protein V1525DRAFT_417798 [Lipomyces kononenkoae]|uniref:Uncharacterized protein n=1 Tax=Lipomyces kononenkoae TaxID=34357 RepID=A0ACC3T620_LIPKO
MPVEEKSRLYLYSVPPPYDDLEDPEETGPFLSSSASSSNCSSARNERVTQSSEERRQQFISRSLLRYEPRQTGDEVQSDNLSTPRTSSESAGLRREIMQLDIVEPPLSGTLLRPSIQSRLATNIKSKLTILRRLSSKLNVFNGLGSRFQFMTAFFHSINNRYNRTTSSLSNSLNTRLEAVGNPRLIKRLAIVFILSLGMWLLIASDLLPIGTSNGGFSSPPQHYPLESMREYFFHEVSAKKIATHIQALTALPHMAGTAGDMSMATYIAQQFRDFNAFDTVETKQYDVFLTYPNRNGQRLALLSDEKTGRNLRREVLYEAILNEVEAEPGTLDKQPFPMHGLSAAGNVTGHMVYANYGTKKDFEKLRALEISLDGAIVFCRYGLVHESLKIKAAEIYGASGVVLFSDRSDKDEASYPDGRAIPEGAVQRGSAGLRNWAPGDPLTPGRPSTPISRKEAKENSTSLVNIPSLPISWDDAKHFLAALRGYGKKVENSSIGQFPGVDEWWTGSADGPMANLRNFPVEREDQPIWNVIAKIEGTDQPEKAIILGAHRDAWCYGASDAMSGTAVMLEVSRILGHIASEFTWRPLRSIYFASWDGTEQNLIGATEWVEENIDSLRQDGVVYINLDQAVSGTQFNASGNPLLNSVLLTALDQVYDPFRNKTIRDLWGHMELPPLEGDKDTIPFQSFAGIASIDLSFSTPGGYPTRTCFDTKRWLNKFGDPSEVFVSSDKLVQLSYEENDLADDGFPYVFHKLLTQIVGAMIIRFADEMNLPFDLSSYARSSSHYMTDLQAYSGESRKLDVQNLVKGISALSESALQIEKWNSEWMNNFMAMGHVETTSMTAHRWSRNSRLTNLDKHLLNMDGLPGRSWLKHIIFAPQMWPPSAQDKSFVASGTFTAVRDALESGDEEEAQRQIDKISDQLYEAARKVVN